MRRRVAVAAAILVACALACSTPPLVHGADINLDSSAGATGGECETMLEQTVAELVRVTAQLDDAGQQVQDAEERVMEAEAAGLSVGKLFERRIAALQSELAGVQARLDEQLLLSTETEERCVVWLHVVLFAVVCVWHGGRGG